MEELMGVSGHGKKKKEKKKPPALINFHKKKLEKLWINFAWPNIAMSTLDLTLQNPKGEPMQEAMPLRDVSHSV